jgi:hypothetical protein
MERVVKNEHGGLETDTMLQTVGSILALVPGKRHGRLVVTNMYIQ